MDREEIIFRLVTEELDEMRVSQVLELAFEALADMLEFYSDAHLMELYGLKNDGTEETTDTPRMH